MGKTFNVSSPTAEFGFNSGDNRDRYIIARANATAAYLATTARASKIAFVIPSGTATVDTQILNVIPAESVITDVAAVYTSAVVFRSKWYFIISNWLNFRRSRNLLSSNSSNRWVFSSSRSSSKYKQHPSIRWIIICICNRSS